MGGTLTHAQRAEAERQRAEGREQAERERDDRRHARLRAEFDQTCRRKSDDQLRWLAGYVADEIAYHESKTVKSPDSYRYLLMAREVTGAEQTRRALPHADGPEYGRVA